MSNDADLDGIKARIERRLATLFRKLCQRELLGGDEAEALVRQATQPPATSTLTKTGAPTSQLRRTAMGRMSPGSEDQGTAESEWAPFVTLGDQSRLSEFLCLDRAIVRGPDGAERKVYPRVWWNGFDQARNIDPWRWKRCK